MTELAVRAYHLACFSVTTTAANITTTAAAITTTAANITTTAAAITTTAANITTTAAAITTTAANITTTAAAITTPSVTVTNTSVTMNSTFGKYCYELIIVNSNNFHGYYDDFILATTLSSYTTSTSATTFISCQFFCLH